MSTAVERFDIAIVGAGPAGVAAALQIRALAAGREARVCLLDRAVFPRPKLCGGGITARTEQLLACLGVALDVPYVRVSEVRFLMPGESATRTGAALFKVVRREEFDAFLLGKALDRGVESKSGDAVRQLRVDDEGVLLTLASGAVLRAAIVIGADGANSTVRRCLVPRKVRVEPFVALEILTPGHDPAARATFDFRTLAEGVRGYAWDFPSLVGGRPFMNRGIASIGEVPRGTLREVFRRVLRARGVECMDTDIEGAWAPLYHPEREQSAPRVLLAGDAVGIDPWLGEGISSAIGTGILAGHLAAAALESGAFGFEDYRERIAASTVGRALRANLTMASRFYGSGSRRSPAPAAKGREEAA